MKKAIIYSLIAAVCVLLVLIVAFVLTAGKSKKAPPALGPAAGPSVAFAPFAA